MQIVIHRANERGVGDHGWLHTRFSFSFADWYDPSKMGFGVLRVINDDVIDARSGFGSHPHANMEIITIVRSGAVSHQDSIGNSYVVPAGDIQVMSAGSGVVHAEFNHEDKPLELFQIWIEPNIRNIVPRYAQKTFGLKGKPQQVELLVSGDGDAHAIQINQNAYISRVRIDSGACVEYVPRDPNHGVYAFLVAGSIRIDGDVLEARDALGVVGTSKIRMEGKAESEVLLFEVPMK